MSISGKRQSRLGTLIEQFVSAFPKLDETADVAEISSDGAELEPLYAKLPARFPPLFEGLVLSYRWAEVDLQTYTLLANPPGQGLSKFLGQLSKDPAFWASLRPAGYIQFAKGPDMDYDPVCFDIKR